ncbi:MAG TPA: hypothetical protein PLB55_14555, partial [Prosthecobacter sp.]|nr:hypothetical protein [Prosthecobacter sp.]
ANDFVSADILVASQPLAFAFTTMRILYLMPLRDDQVTAFARVHVALWKKRQADALARFIHEAISQNLPLKELERNREILLNPLDLLFVCELIEAGTTPDMQGILRQQHQRMAADYHAIYQIDFPDERFSKFVYEARTKGDSDEFGTGGLGREWEKLQEFQLARLQVGSVDSGDARQWVMRHPRVCDFYTAVCWCFDQVWEQDNSTLTRHAGDPRFWGAFYLLLKDLDTRQRKLVFDKLLRWSAQNQQHTLLDGLVSEDERRHPTPETPLLRSEAGSQRSQSSG